MKPVLTAAIVLTFLSLNAQTSEWQVRQSPLNEHLYGVTYGEGLYVAVGNNRTILTSPQRHSLDAAHAQYELARLAMQRSAWQRHVCRGRQRFSAIVAAILAVDVGAAGKRWFLLAHECRAHLGLKGRNSLAPRPADPFEFQFLGCGLWTRPICCGWPGRFDDFTRWPFMDSSDELLP